MAAAATVLLASCGGGMPKFGDNEYAVRTVETSAASLQTTYPATLKGVQDVEIRPKVSGFITKICVDEGQAVSAGQLLFVIDNTTYQAAVRQAQAAVNTAQSQLSTTKLTYENSQKLLERNVIGQYEMETAKNSYETAKAGLAQAQAALTSARETLGFCYVKSPAAGTVGSLPFDVGALVSASSMEPLTTVSNNSKVEAFFSMTEKDLLSMARTSGGVKAALAAMPQVKLLLADGSEYAHPGKVERASGVIDQATGTVSMIAVFPNPDKVLKSGGTAKIVMPKTDNGAILVAQDAVSEVQNKKFVYKVGKDNKVKYTEITVDPQNDGKTYIVTGGLKVGDRYVSKGITSLTDGLEIKPMTEAEYNKKIEDAAKMGEANGSADAAKKLFMGK